MEEKLIFKAIPDYDSTLTFESINSDNIDEIKYGLLSLTHYSGNPKLIIETLEIFIKNDNSEIQLIVIQCLSRYMELFGTLPLDDFLPHLIKGYYNENDDIKYFAKVCLKNIILYVTSKNVYNKKEINYILKTGQSIDIIKVIIFVSENNINVRFINSFIKKCLMHDNSIIQFYGGLLLSQMFNRISIQILELETATKEISKLKSDDLNVNKIELITTLEIIQEDIIDLKAKLEKKN